MTPETLSNLESSTASNGDTNAPIAGMVRKSFGIRHEDERRCEDG